MPYGNNRPVQLAVATQVVHFSQIAPEHFLQLSIMMTMLWCQSSVQSRYSWITVQTRTLTLFTLPINWSDAISQYSSRLPGKICCPSASFRRNLGPPRSIWAVSRTECWVRPSPPDLSSSAQARSGPRPECKPRWTLPRTTCGSPGLCRSSWSDGLADHDSATGSKVPFSF